MAIVSGLYGHGNKGGKLYSYNDPGGTRRVGDNVVVEAYNNKAGRVVKTMLTIKSTHDSGTVGERDTKDFLENRGIGLRTVEGGSLRELPGFKSQQTKNPNFTVKQWKNDAKAAYDLETEYRLLPGMTSGQMRDIRSQIKGLRG